MKARSLAFVLTLAALVGCSLSILPPNSNPLGTITLEAQTVPYTLVVTYPASPDAVTYNCYLDGAVVASGVTSLTCSFPVPALGAHTVGVTAVNPAFVPTESDPSTLAFTLKQPVKPGTPKVK